jgi:hypothetical protein
MGAVSVDNALIINATLCMHKIWIKRQIYAFTVKWQNMKRGDGMP